MLQGSLPSDTDSDDDDFVPGGDYDSDAGSTDRDDYTDDDLADSASVSFSDASESATPLSAKLVAQLNSLDKDTLREMIQAFKKEEKNTESVQLERYGNSVVEVTINSKAYDYEAPWMPPTPTSGRGSGFIVNYDGKPCLVTNAHCADQATFLEVKLADGDQKFKATVKVIDHDCDLALLEVDDPKFWEAAVPLEMGSMPKQRQELNVFGFPMGGDGFCITQGQVSRILVDSYAESGVELLQAQVSAAINPGNSGGPAIQDGKVLGVAFQGYNVGEGLGYIIAPPVLDHFLKNALAQGPYLGFPSLAISSQNLTVKRLRDHFGLDDSQSGIRVKEVAPTSSANGLLKAGDILLEIDGKKVSNTGKVDCEDGKSLSFEHMIAMKCIGDNIAIKVMREGAEVELSVPLMNRANTTYYSGREYDKGPTYYINSGVVMMPLTDNFCDDASGFFSSLDIDLEKLSSQYKKEPGEEIVFIHSVFAAEETKGLKGLGGSIIKEVNGKPIKNLREAKAAFEANEADHHVITTSKKDVLLIDNLNRTEHRALLKKYGVSKTQSDDLKGPAHYQPGCPEATALLIAFEQAKAKTATLARKDEEADEAPTTRRRRKVK